MTPKGQRTLIRLAGFAGGVLVGLALSRPWQEGPGPHRVSDYIMVLVTGLLAVAIVEFARRFLPAQRELDADEADSLSDADVRRLLAVRKYVRAAALAFGLLLPLLIFPADELESYPATAIAASVFYALFLWVVAEIALSLHPRQRILRAALRQRRRR